LELLADHVGRSAGLAPLFSLRERRSFFFGLNTMTNLEAHALLSQCSTLELATMLHWPRVQLSDEHRRQHNPEVFLPLYATACASLSGQVEDARTLDDLKEAVDECLALFAIEVFGEDDLHLEVESIFAELETFARQFDRREVLN
jgi:hypothetical protein